MIMEVIVGIFGFVLTILGTLILSYFKRMSNNMENMDRNMTAMNLKLATVITDQSWHKEEIMEIKTRVSQLEQLEQ